MSKPHRRGLQAKAQGVDAARVQREELQPPDGFTVVALWVGGLKGVG